MKKIERPKSLAELVVDRLRKGIIAGDYGLGEPLSESRIAADFGTSKGPVRRAFVQLQVEGLVRVVPQSGTFVFSLGTEEIVKLSECRLILEEAALRLAIASDRDSLGRQLADYYDGMVKARKSGDNRSYLMIDTKFHESIVVHSHNSYLADAYRLVSGKSAALRTHLSSNPEQTSLSFEEHKIIADATRAGDTKLALKTLRVHIGRAPQTYAKHIEDIAEYDRMKASA